MFYILAIVLLILFLSAAIKVLREYQRGLLFRSGRIIGVIGPGLVIVIPIIDKLVKVNLSKRIPEWRELSKEELQKRIEQVVMSESESKITKVQRLREQPRDTMKYRPPVEQVIPRIKLWNPNPIAGWSLLFTPLFGSTLTFMNWRALGKDEEAKKALVWILISALVLVAFLFILDAAAHNLAPAPLGIVAFILVWYSSLNRPQAKYFKTELNNQYIKKKWGKPLGLALGGLVGYFICIVIAIVGFYNTQAGFWSYWGDYDRAIANFTKAIEVNPRDEDAYIFRGDAWFNKGDYECAIADYSKAIEINPRFALAYCWRGEAWGHKGDYDRAIADFNKALEIDPRYANAYNNLAWLLATCPDARYRNGAKAVELAQKAVELDRSACWLDTLAAAYAEAGKFEDAITTQEKAIALHEKEGVTKNHIDKFIERLNYYKAHKPWREK